MKADSLDPCRFPRMLRRHIVAAISLLAFLNCSAKFVTAQSLSMLHSSGVNIVDANGNKVSLRGVNLGGWLTIETWMTPADSSGFPDNYSIIKTLDNRFGVAKDQSLVQTYHQTRMTTADLGHIRAKRMNVILLPLWSGNFQTLHCQ